MSEIYKNPLYTKKTTHDINGETECSCIITNTPINNHLIVKMIGYEKCAGDKKKCVHTFECNTLHFIISGKGLFDGVSLKANNGFMVKKNHKAEYIQDKNEPWEYCWINFDGVLGNHFLDKLGLEADKCTFYYPDISAIKNMLFDALETDYSETDISLSLVSVLINIFAYLSKNTLTYSIYPGNSVRENRVHEAVEYINKNYMNKNCISNLASVQNVDKRYLSRLFREFSDLSPQGHLIRLRIEESKRLLRTTDISIGAVGEKVGYDDILQFSKIFRKHTGVSPSDFRKGMEDLHREYE